jgi:uracil-DNA glycosylase family 4
MSSGLHRLWKGGSKGMAGGGFVGLRRDVITCRLCPRLVRWREEAARNKVRRFLDQDYWGKPIPGFGDPHARLLLVGLAPAAHGGNRTGRMFTGDESGNWLFRALHRSGFANQPESVDSSDGLVLKDCYITATCRCAPPQNKLLPKEIQNCRPFLRREIALLKNVRVVVGLGRIGFDTALTAFRDMGLIEYRKRPEFGHGARYRLAHYTFIASFHPSQQNTFTGRLTRPMLDRIFRTAQAAVALKEQPQK